MLLYMTPSELQSDTAAIVASWSLWTCVERQICRKRGRESRPEVLYLTQPQSGLAIPS